MKLITIFTPTYNRAHILHKCYESLKKQTSFNFNWLIVDDGSTDNTRELCEKWCKEESRFEIEYIFKENGGLHTAYNVAVERVETEVFCCLESDDYFTPDAVAIIESMWEIIKDSSYVGFVSLTKNPNGELIGEKYPEDLKSVYYYEHRKYAKGDKQYVFKTEMLKKVFPQKSFPGEKFFDPKYSFHYLDQFGQLAVTNYIFDVADYQPGGLTDTVIKHYMNSPNSFCEYRKMYMTRPKATPLYITTQNIHYVAECSLAHKLRSAIRESPKPVYTLLAFLPGISLSIYIRIKNKRIR